jgi:carbonic anhydrase
MFVNENVEAFYDYFSYYYYNGSLTNPQCDENVRWMVAADPIPLGISIYQMFNDANGKGIPNYKGNNRNIQPRNDR